MSNIEFRESELLLVSKIKESSDNPRKTITDDSISELQESIKKVGLLQPVLVKEIKGKKFNYEVVAGSRRFRACKNLKWDHIPGIVVSGDEVEYQQIALIENCQRMDMSPVEECHSYQELQKGGMTGEEIADRIGKSIKYVFDRLALGRLCDQGLVLLHDGVINITQAKVLCMIKKDEQDQIISKYAFREGTDIIGLQPSSKLKEFITNNIQQTLASAIFDTKDKKLTAAGSCMDCPKRTGSNKLLFEDFESDDICLDKICYRNKKIAHLDLVKNDLEQKGFEVIKATNYGWTDEDQEMEYKYYGHFRSVNPEEVTEESPVERYMIIYNGADVGKVIPILTDLQSEIRKSEQFENSEEVKSTNKAYHKAIETTIMRCAEKVAQFDKNLLNLSMKKILTSILWKESDIDVKKNIVKLMGWEVELANQCIDYRDFDINNDEQFLLENMPKMDENKMDQTISWLLFGSIQNGIMDNRLIFELAESLKINFEKDILPEVNKEFGTKISIENFIKIESND